MVAPAFSTDITLEYFFQKNGFIQLALFDRRIDGYLQNFSQDETIDGKQYSVSRPQNSGKGKLNGAEFGVQKFFDFMPAPWNGFGAQFNYTLINGSNQTKTSLNGTEFVKTALVGIAKNSLNVALLYEGHGVTDEADAIIGEQDARGFERRREWHQARHRAVIGDIGMGIDRNDPRHGERRAGIDATNFGMGIGRAQGDAIEHAVALQIVGELALARQQANILDTLDRLACPELHRSISLKQAIRPARYSG